ncbi:MAG: TolC family protein [Bacteroidales bacterium]|nr:TolC family protein [Bacteroidales bacterium]
MSIQKHETIIIKINQSVMICRISVLLALLIAAQPCFALQGLQGLTIEECQQKARDNYPLILQHGYINLSEQYTISNIGKLWLPQITFQAQAVYQSDVVHFPLSLPGVNIPTIDKDQYRAAVDVSQTVWDGGVARSQRKIVEAGNDVDRQNVEVNLYTLRERINQLFFGILTIDEQLKQLDILEKDLQASLKLAGALLQNGTAMQSDVDAVQVEILNTGQQRIELTSFRKAYTAMLSIMTGETLDDVQLIKPEELAVSRQTDIMRPEMQLFSRQNDLFDAQSGSIRARNMPRLSLFVQGGYGKPGLNILSSDFEFFATGGVRLNWNFGNLYSSKNERSLLANNKNMVNVQRETFVFNTSLQLTQAWNEIQKARELMQSDDEIINLRHRVKTAGESKYANGVYTVNDLVKDINAESRSRQAKILHEVQYLMRIYHYMVIAGK